jgi:hypothetical protein
MDSDQVDPLGAQPGETLLDLRQALFAIVDAHLRRKKQTIANTKLLDQLPKHLLRLSIGRSGVDHLAAELQEARDCRLQRGELRLTVRIGITPGRADPDDRQLTLGTGDFAVINALLAAVWARGIAGRAATTAKAAAEDTKVRRFIPDIFFRISRDEIDCTTIGQGNRNKDGPSAKATMNAWRPD